MASTNHPKESKTLVELLQDLPTREKLVAVLAKKTKSHPSSVYRWLKGEVTPPALKREIIAKHFKVSVEELFPKSKSK